MLVWLQGWPTGGLSRAEEDVGSSAGSGACPGLGHIFLNPCWAQAPGGLKSWGCPQCSVTEAEQRTGPRGGIRPVQGP